ncbi:Oligopeptide-binding protein AppA precursor [Vibrio quintilis]|uniref:Oligopeptide-binding protein AppA n=2 Tax=Vibrio quintilis TaxID=1117707 RepID=A0A1M7Z057_9VIBR|nr:extracellular solute-binding protein [Vibrio quintilis]SHO58298.1 Oligopeptide-binding protein AppA precursor [Vibrio quintilis]
MGKIKSVILGCTLMVLSTASFSKVITTTHLVGFGKAKYAAGFKHFDYVNPDAPKYGKVVFGTIGTFDNFNRYASRGVAAVDSGTLYDALMYSPSDEIDAYYPLIATTIRYSDDYSWLEADINPKARFQDGVPITAHDVAFSFQKFMKEGVPQFRVLYKTFSVKALNDHTVRFAVTKPDRDRLFGLAEGLPVLPEHFWKDKNFAEPLSKPPVGSGPYKIVAYKMGQSVTYGLDDNYWAKDLPVNVGRHNFKQKQYDYYRDDTVMLEAFKAGEFDFRQEGQAKLWATAYTGPNFDNGSIVKESIEHHKPAATQGFIFNTSRPVFQDPKVREALTYALDFEWMNKNLFYNQYKRTRSYFGNTEFEAKGLPSKAEQEVLAPFKAQLPPRLYTQAFNSPVTDGSGRIRKQIRQAFRLLKQAGWAIKDGVMTNQKTGQPLSFELLTFNPVTERIAIPLQKNLKHMGIEMKIRTVDTTQYTKRLRDRDFDMVSSVYSAHAFPDPNLMIAWNSRYLNSTYNIAGVQSPIVDKLTEEIAASQEDPDKLLVLGRAFDRVLQWNFYMIPQWYSNQYRVAMWDKFERPAVIPQYDLGLDTWWVSQKKEKMLKLKKDR